MKTVEQESSNFFIRQGMTFKQFATKGYRDVQTSRNPSLSLLKQLVRQLLQAITQMSVENKLWIVEIGRIRIHQSEKDEEP